VKDPASYGDNNNTIALLNSTTKAGNLRRGVVFPPRVWLAFEGFSIHGFAARIAFALSYGDIAISGLQKEKCLSLG
jgi:hypothetical protein